MEDMASDHRGRARPVALWSLCQWDSHKTYFSLSAGGTAVTTRRISSRVMHTCQFRSLLWKLYARPLPSPHQRTIAAVHQDGIVTTSPFPWWCKTPQLLYLRCRV